MICPLSFGVYIKRSKSCSITFGVSYHDGGSIARGINNFPNMGWNTLIIERVDGSLYFNGSAVVVGQNIDVSQTDMLNFTHYQPHYGGSVTISLK